MQCRNLRLLFPHKRALAKPGICTAKENIDSAVTRFPRVSRLFPPPNSVCSPFAHIRPETTVARLTPPQDWRWAPPPKLKDYTGKRSLRNGWRRKHSLTPAPSIPLHRNYTSCWGTFIGKENPSQMPNRNTAKRLLFGLETMVHCSDCRWP